MSQENVEIVARLVDAWNQANVEAMLVLFDPECEVTFPPEVPEPGPFHGHTELREWAEGFLAAWESHHAEVVELIEADHSIVAILHLIGRGSGSGIEMDETVAAGFRGAPRAGFEPAAYSLGGSRSIQLSYRGSAAG